MKNFYVKSELVNPRAIIINTMNLRSISPFIAFCKAKREEVKAANPTAELGDMGRLLAARWKKMTEIEKAVYSTPRRVYVAAKQEPEPALRRSSRLRNKRLGLNFWGLKV